MSARDAASELWRAGVAAEVATQRLANLVFNGSLTADEAEIRTITLALYRVADEILRLRQMK